MASGAYTVSPNRLDRPGWCLLVGPLTLWAIINRCEERRWVADYWMITGCGTLYDLIMS